MNPNPMSAMDVNDNDKLLAALAYFLAPLVSIIILLVDTMKSRPYQYYHAINALPLGIVQILLACTIGPFTFGCLNLLLFLLQIFYTIKAYQNGPTGYFEIPVISQFMKQQGWLKGPGSM